MEKILIIQDMNPDEVRFYIKEYADGVAQFIKDNLAKVNGLYVNGDKIENDTEDLISDLNESLDDGSTWVRISKEQLITCKPDFIYFIGFYL